MGHLQATTEEAVDGAVVRVEGEIDLANASELAEMLEPAGTSGGPVTVDLADVTFIDSSGLHALLEFAAHSLNGNGPLTIANPSRTVRRVMEIVGMTELAHIQVQVDNDHEHG
ncbi:MAG TPA: STAS domain-containing protein [Actinomycetota bacterium]|nr:STAS domain-containing protein [Actinomycetota bacterium]